MMSIEKKATIYLHRKPIDFRLQINGLSLVAQEQMTLDPFAEALFVFVNRNRNRIKILYWQRNGFCLWLKRLEKDKFVWPKHLDNNVISLNGQELLWLLDGFDIWRQPPHQMLEYTFVG